MGRPAVIPLFPPPITGAGYDFPGPKAYGRETRMARHLRVAIPTPLRFPATVPRAITRCFARGYPAAAGHAEPRAGASLRSALSESARSEVSDPPTWRQGGPQERRWKPARSSSFGLSLDTRRRSPPGKISISRFAEPAASRRFYPWDSGRRFLPASRRAARPQKR